MKQTPKKMVPKAVSNKRVINLYLLFSFLNNGRVMCFIVYHFEEKNTNFWTTWLTIIVSLTVRAYNNYDMIDLLVILFFNDICQNPFILIVFSIKTQTHWRTTSRKHGESPWGYSPHLDFYSFLHTVGFSTCHFLLIQMCPKKGKKSKLLFFLLKKKKKDES